MSSKGQRGSLVAWIRAGERLARVDPKRLADLTQLAQRFALAHENPFAPELRGVADERTDLSGFPEASCDLSADID